MKHRKLKIKNAGFIQTPKNLLSGFTLLVAIVVTSMLMLVSFVVANIALKQLVLTYSGQESQYSFYNADSGVECAQYWDLHYGPVSAFATSTAGSLTCNNISGTNPQVTSGSQSITTIPSGYGFSSPEPSIVGGAGAAHSIFQVNYTHGCAVVVVTKQVNGNTTIDSRGYNSCDVTSDRRFERGVTITY